MVCIQGALKVAYLPYVGFNATQKTGQKTSNIVQFIEFAILSFWPEFDLQRRTLQHRHRLLPGLGLHKIQYHDDVLVNHIR